MLVRYKVISASTVSAACQLFLFKPKGRWRDLAWAILLNNGQSRDECVTLQWSNRVLLNKLGDNLTQKEKISGQLRCIVRSRFQYIILVRGTLRHCMHFKTRAVALWGRTNKFLRGGRGFGQIPKKNSCTKKIPRKNIVHK